MSEKRWAWVIWWTGLVALIALAIPTLGFTVPFIVGWWVGGPFHVSEEGDVAPFWKPMGPEKLWWRDFR